jgi:hypothetical protein
VQRRSLAASSHLSPHAGTIPTDISHLEVACVDPIGWSATTVPDPTAASYAGVLAVLAERLTVWRHQGHPGAAGASRNLLACACGCPRRIRVAPATLQQAAPILCAACQLPFTPTPAA